MALNPRHIVENIYNDVVVTECEHYASLQRAAQLPETLENNVSLCESFTTDKTIRKELVML